MTQLEMIRSTLSMVIIVPACLQWYRKWLGIIRPPRNLIRSSSSKWMDTGIWWFMRLCMCYTQRAVTFARTQISRWPDNPDISFSGQVDNKCISPWQSRGALRHRALGVVRIYLYFACYLTHRQGGCFCRLKLKKTGQWYKLVEIGRNWF